MDSESGTGLAIASQSHNGTRKHFQPLCPSAYLAGPRPAHKGSKLPRHSSAADALEQLQARLLAAVILLVLAWHGYKVLQLPVHLQFSNRRRSDPGPDPHAD